MYLLEALKIVPAVLMLKEVEDSERISYRVSIKRLVSQDKKCVLYTKSNGGDGFKSFQQRSGMIRFLFENHHRSQE